MLIKERSNLQEELILVATVLIFIGFGMVFGWYARAFTTHDKFIRAKAEEAISLNAAREMEFSQFVRGQKDGR